MAVDYSPEAIDKRLKRVERLRGLRVSPSMAEPLDMSPEAVTARIKIGAELHYLHLSLSKAKPVKKKTDSNGVRESHESYGTKHGPKTTR